VRISSVVLGLVLLFVVSVASAQEDTAYIQFVHVAVDVQTVDVLVDDEIWLDHVERSSATPFTSLPAGQQRISVRGQDGELVGLELDLAPDSWAVVALIGTRAENALRLDLQPVSVADFTPQHGRIFLYNPLVDGIRLEVLNGEEPLATLSGEDGWTGDLPSGTHALTLWQGETIVADLSELVIAPYQLYVASLTNPERTLLLAQTDLSTTVQIYPLAADLPPLSLVLDEEPVLQEVAFDTSNAETVIPSGSYTVQLMAEGVIFEEEGVTFSPGSLTTFWVRGLLADGSLEVQMLREDPARFADNAALLRGQNAFVMLYHEIPDAPPLDVVLPDGTVLIESLAFRDGVGVLDMIAGEYDLFITVAGDPATVLYDLSDVTLRGGLAYTFVAVGQYAEVRNRRQRLFIDFVCMRPC